ncbi:hypothetical protein F511_13201 [Dorcoceras hygrometricum]|uniref:Uncharacterized protein n=1 Tax=Dorcoceras hygrometricum TaxID=472368 RepID=A0A2Z7AH55_9LAMI|nr:hypothetical protein F511_13201 [Dorcoceras hygrometricum]
MNPAEARFSARFLKRCRCRKFGNACVVISRRKRFAWFCVLMLDDQQLVFESRILSDVVWISWCDAVLRTSRSLLGDCFSVDLRNQQWFLASAAFTRVFGISSSVIVLSIRYGFELILRRGYGLEELLRGRAGIPHSHLPAGIVATMRRVVNYHSSWARQQQVELFDASGNPGSTAGRGFNPTGGAPGGPRPDARLLRQPVLKGLTRSARTDSPCRIGRNEFRRLGAAAALGGGGGGFCERGGAAT